MSSNQIVLFGSVVIVLFLVNGASAPPPAPHICPSGQEYHHECKPNCRNTCETYNLTTTDCKPTCQRGCGCKTGTVLRKDKTCVEPSKCYVTGGHDTCPAGEVYSTCANPCNDCKTRGKCDFLVCNEGCNCPEGHHRGKGGKCIPASQCPTKSACTGVNEEVVSCAKPAWCNTCSVRGNCKLTEASCTEGCDCKPGHFRDDNGVCVPEDQYPCLEDCPGINEEYNSCGTACPVNCSNFRGEPASCTAECVAGCFCKKGFVRNDNNVCVPTDQCPKNVCCGDHEVYKDCGPACEKTCSNMNKDIVCAESCKDGCFCQDGYVRNDDEECVPPEECPAC